MKPVRFHEIAQQEAGDAANWYLGIRESLAIAFRDEMTAVLSIIAANPEQFALEPDPFRIAAFKRFPYSLIYTIYEDFTWVVAVEHHRRKPKYWLQRLPQG